MRLSQSRHSTFFTKFLIRVYAPTHSSALVNLSLRLPPMGRHQLAIAVGSLKIIIWYSAGFCPRKSHSIQSRLDHFTRRNPFLTARVGWNPFRTAPAIHTRVTDNHIIPVSSHSLSLGPVESNFLHITIGIWPWFSYSLALIITLNDIEGVYTHLHLHTGEIHPSCLVSLNLRYRPLPQAQSTELPSPIDFFVFYFILVCAYSSFLAWL